MTIVLALGLTVGALDGCSSCSSQKHAVNEGATKAENLKWPDVTTVINLAATFFDDDLTITPYDVKYVSSRARVFATLQSRHGDDLPIEGDVPYRTTYDGKDGYTYLIQIRNADPDKGMATFHVDRAKN